MDSCTPSIKLLNASIDCDPSEDSELRILVDNQSIKYLTISGGVYEPEDIAFEPALVPQLPTLPSGDWNTARISRDAATGLPHFEDVKEEELPQISNLWHQAQVDYLELQIGRKLRSNVYEATCSLLGSDVFVVKFARFSWEVAQLAAETTAYEWIEGHDIGPKFLGHILEHGRAIGFIIARIEDFRHAAPEDLTVCRQILLKLHDLGIKHGDINKHNFLIHNSGARLIDFDFASTDTSEEDLNDELERLPISLSDTSGRGGAIRE